MTTCSGTTVSAYKNRHRTIRVTVTGPGDITGSKIWFSIKASRNDVDAAALVTKRSANIPGGSDDQAKVTDGPHGVLEVYIVPDDTKTLEASDYYFDVVIETAAGRKVEAVDPSTFKILQPVTVTE